MGEQTFALIDISRIASRSSNRLEIWSRFVSLYSLTHILEVGIFDGAFAEHMLKECRHIKQYHMVDPWKHLSDWDKPANLSDKVFERLLQTVRDRTRFASEKTIVHRGRTTEVIDDIADHSLDFAYIDGDHTLRGICIDLIKSYSKVKSKGFIAGDDCIADSFVQHGAKFEPTLVFPFVAYFAEAMGHEICFLPHNQFLINKSTKRFRIIDMAGTYGDVSLRRQLALINMLKRNVPVPIRKAVRSIRTWARRVS